MVKRLLRSHKSLTHTKLGGAPLRDTYCITPAPLLEFDWLSAGAILDLDWTSYWTYVLLLHLYCSSTGLLLVMLKGILLHRDWSSTRLLLDCCWTSTGFLLHLCWTSAGLPVDL